MEMPSRAEPYPPEERTRKGGDISGLLIFFCVLVFLALVRVLLGYVAVPLQLVMPTTLAATVLFISAPIFALYFAAKYRWTAKSAMIFLLVGLVIHLGLGLLVGAKLLGGKGFAAAVCLALAPQVGLVMWCVGLGALLAALLKDRNLLIPVSIFLAAFDIFLVLTPLGPTKQILQQMPNVLPAVAYSLPKASAAPTQGPVGQFAYIGPADFLFMGMFFVALYKFGMKARETAYWLIPTILVYLLLALLLGPVPLLVPIGLCVLAVNAKEFSLNKEEKISTAAVAVLGVLIIGSSILLRGARAAPSKATGQATSAPAGSPPQASAGQRP
jgi:hypothetical protein